MLHELSSIGVLVNALKIKILIFKINLKAIRNNINKYKFYCKIKYIHSVHSTS